MTSSYARAVAAGELIQDPAQDAAASKLAALAQALKPARFSLFRTRPVPKGLYIWGDVGRGKTMLMDMFFADAPLDSIGVRRTPGEKKQRLHFNAFMAQTHARIHVLRSQPGMDDPIPHAARAIAKHARLLCFDEFQVTDVADAMILGRLFEQFFASGMVIVATSNTPPQRLYAGGLNRQLFAPFIDLIQQKMEVVTLNGPTDYRLQNLRELDVYMMPLSPATDAAMDVAWAKVAGGLGKPAKLTVLGRSLLVPRAGRGAARFTFEELCGQPLGGADYLALARDYHTVFLDHIPVLTPEMRNWAKRFTLLIDTLYDEGVKLVCSAAAPPEALLDDTFGAEAFRRTVSRLVEMRSEAYLQQGHGLHQLSSPASEGLAGEDGR